MHQASPATAPQTCGHVLVKGITAGLTSLGPPPGRAQLNLDDGLRSNQASSLDWLNGWRLSHLSVQITLGAGAGVRRTQVAVRR